MKFITSHFGFLFFITPLPKVTKARTPHPCYYNVNQIASDDLIPCYPSTFSTHYSCCLIGDKCLRHNACYDSDTGISYQHGCTDPTFQDLHCPQKCSLDTEKSRWVGLIFCDGNYGAPKDTWVCHHPDNCGSYADCFKKTWRPGLEHLMDSDCYKVDHGQKFVAFKESSTLSDIAALPVSTELSSWWAANSDRTKAAITSVSGQQTTGLQGFTWPTTTSIPSLTGQRTISLDTPSSISPDTQAPASSPSKAAAIGLGVGIGIPFLLSLVGLTYFLKRRHRKKSQPEPETTTTGTPFPAEKGDGSVIYAHTGDAAPGYGHKSELDSTPIIESVGSPRVSELAGSMVGTPFVSPETGQGEFGGEAEEEEEDGREKRIMEYRRERWGLL